MATEILHSRFFFFTFFLFSSSLNPMVFVDKMTFPLSRHPDATYLYKKSHSWCINEQRAHSTRAHTQQLQQQQQQLNIHVGFYLYCGLVYSTQPTILWVKMKKDNLIPQNIQIQNIWMQKHFLLLASWALDKNKNAHSILNTQKLLGISFSLFNSMPRREFTRKKNILLK